MKLNNGATEFEPHPVYQGVAVVVDATEPYEINDTYKGDGSKKTVFKVVMETELKRDDGKPWTISTMPFSLNIGPKSNFRKFLNGTRGSDITEEEAESFDTESLMGQSFYIETEQTESKDGKKTYDGLVQKTVNGVSVGWVCEPLKDGQQPLKPSGNYVRRKDRQGSGSGSGTMNTGSPTSETTSKKKADKNPLNVKVHVGKFKGSDLLDLDEEAIEVMYAKWYLKKFKSTEKPSADDKRLAKALETWKTAHDEAGAEEEDGY